jgi:23S rRNA (pseudouridine1915-N3)-methyltransferase
MLLKLCWIGKTKAASVQALTEDYLKRIRRYLPAESHELRNEAALRELLVKDKAKSKSGLVLVLLDSGGRQMSSEELAGFLRRQQECGVHSLVFVVGPADGWSSAMREIASFGSAPVSAIQYLSLGKMTLAHEVARVVLLEQIYRGFTILAGHPYHLGHMGCAT